MDSVTRIFPFLSLPFCKLPAAKRDLSICYLRISSELCPIIGESISSKDVEICLAVLMRAGANSRRVHGVLLHRVRSGVLGDSGPFGLHALGGRLL